MERGGYKGLGLFRKFVDDSNDDEIVSVPTLQEVTNEGYVTTRNIEANGFKFLYERGGFDLGDSKEYEKQGTSLAGLTKDHNDNLYYAIGWGTLRKISVDGTITDYSISFGSKKFLFDQNYHVYYRRGSSFYKFNFNSEIETLVVSSPNSTITDYAVDRYGFFYFLTGYGGYINKVEPDGTFHYGWSDHTSGERVKYIAADDYNRVYFCGEDTGAINQLNSDGSFFEIANTGSVVKVFHQHNGTLLVVSGYNIYRINSTSGLINSVYLGFNVKNIGVDSSWNIYLTEDTFNSSPRVCKVNGLTATTTNVSLNNNGGFAVLSDGSLFLEASGSSWIHKLSLYTPLLYIDSNGYTRKYTDFRLVSGAAHAPKAEISAIVRAKDLVTKEYVESFFQPKEVETINYHEFACSDETDPLEVKRVYSQRFLRDFENCTRFDFSVEEAPVGGDLLLDIRINNTAIFDIPPVIKEGEFSTLENTIAVLTNGKTDIVAGDLLEVFVTQIGPTNAGKNLKGQITYQTNQS